MPTKNMTQVKLYKRRWIFLFGIFLLQFCAGQSFASYGQINWFYVQFFNATPAQVDWITNARNISAIFIVFPLALLIFKDKVGLKELVLLISGSATIGFLFVTLSLINRSLFALIVLGQLVCGLADTLCLALPATFAVLWFPENQVGSAIALNTLGMYFGTEVAYVLPSYLVTPSNHTLLKGEVLSLNALAAGQSNLRYMYGALLAMCAAVTTLFAIFLTDKPPTPPTYAQELKNNEVKVQRSTMDFLVQTKNLFTIPSYTLITVALGIVFQLELIENMFMSEIIAEIHISHNVAPSTLSGYIMCMVGVGAILGISIGGKVVDRCKKYKLLALCTTASLFISTVGMAISALCRNTPGIYVSNALYGFFTGFSLVILFEMVTQLTYPIDETLVNTLMTPIHTMIGLLMGVVARVMFQHWRSIGVLAFQCACVLLGVLLLFLVSSRNRRLEVGDQNGTIAKQENAETPLLNSQQ